MLEFLTDLRHYPFLQYALLAGVLASVASGLVGSYVTVRRTTYVAGAISHTLLGGMGAARYCQKVYGWEFFTPLLGALLAALLAAVIIALVSAYGKQREDTVLGAVWAIGMAVGVGYYLLSISTTVIVLLLLMADDSQFKKTEEKRRLSVKG